MALGLGSLTGGIFHLFTHAFFKALLFLGAGSIIHAVHTQNINEMGGLGKPMRLTAWTFAIGALALAGIPPFAGFWSKDLILTVALEENPLLFALGLGAAFCTALYMTRLYVLVFLGKSRSPQGGSALGKVKESPWVMTLPLVVLAALSLVAGFVETPWNGWLGTWLSDERVAPHGSAVAIASSIAVGLLGLVIGWLIYGKGRISRTIITDRMPWLTKLLENKYYVDECYEAVIIKPLRAFGTGLMAFDTYVIGGAVKLAGSAASGASKLALKLQNGHVQTYSVAAVIGFIVIIIAIIGRRILS